MFFIKLVLNSFQPLFYYFKLVNLNHLLSLILTKNSKRALLLLTVLNLHSVVSLTELTCFKTSKLQTEKLEIDTNESINLVYGSHCVNNMAEAIDDPIEADIQLILNFIDRKFSRDDVMIKLKNHLFDVNRVEVSVI